jgi:hypothetical protein
VEKDKTGRQTVKVNILTVFLFNEAQTEPSVEFLSSFEFNLSPPAPRNEKMRTIKEQPRGFNAILRPLSTCLLRFLKSDKPFHDLVFI